LEKCTDSKKNGVKFEFNCPNVEFFTLLQQNEAGPSGLSNGMQDALREVVLNNANHSGSGKVHYIQIGNKLTPVQVIDEVRSPTPKPITAVHSEISDQEISEISDFSERVRYSPVKRAHNYNRALPSHAPTMDHTFAASPAFAKPPTPRRAAPKEKWMGDQKPVKFENVPTYWVS
jgi:hypothetical protein